MVPCVKLDAQSRHLVVWILRHITATFVFKVDFFVPLSLHVRPGADCSDSQND